MQNKWIFQYEESMLTSLLVEIKEKRANPEHKNDGQKRKPELLL